MDNLPACSSLGPPRYWRGFGWVVTLGVFVHFFIFYGFLYSYSVLFVSLRDEFKSSAAVTGWVGSTALGLVSLLSPLGGYLLKRWSYRTVTIVGTTVYCAGLFATSMVTDIGLAFLTFGVLPALGGGIVVHSAVCLVCRWFPTRNNARALCFAVFGSSAGYLVIAPVMSVLIQEYGWRSMLKILGGVSFVIEMIVSTFLMVSPPPGQEAPTCLATVYPPPGKADKEADVYDEKDLDKEGCDETGKTQFGIEATEKEERGEDSATTGFLGVIRDADVWLFMLSVLFANIGWAFIYINFASFMRSLGFDIEQTAFVLLLSGIGEMAGKLLTAMIGDHLPFRQFHLASLSSIFGAVVSGCMLLSYTLAGMTVISVVLAFFRSVMNAIGFPASYELFSSSYGDSSATSIVLIPWGIGSLVGAPILGGLFDLTGNYYVSLLVLLSLFPLSAACLELIVIRKRLRRWLSCRRSYDTRKGHEQSEVGGVDNIGLHADDET